MHDPEPYAGGGTTGGKCGCAAALLIGLAVGGFLMLWWFMGDCPPGAPCHDGEVVRFWSIVLVAAAVATAGGLLVHYLVNRLLGRH
jgi:hypothetical protein